MKASERWFVYVARCSDGTLYTGIARDVRARLRAHDEGRGARYTRGRGPLVLCMTRRCTSKGDALSLELAVKRLGRVDKEEMVHDHGTFRSFARRILAARRVAVLARESKRSNASRGGKRR